MVAGGRRYGSWDAPGLSGSGGSPAQELQGLGCGPRWGDGQSGSRQNTMGVSGAAAADDRSRWPENSMGTLQGEVSEQKGIPASRDGRIPDFPEQCVGKDGL